jgi:hypothetical protein
MFFQLLTLPVMLVLSRLGRNIYYTGVGAYVYDLPVPLQAVHIITVVVLLERYLRTKAFSSAAMLGVSGLLFLVFTWLMRDVTLFRGFYIAGVMIVGIAALQRIKGRVGYAWLILPIVGLQPFFQYLGGARTLGNEQLAEQGLVDAVFEDQTLGEAYWNFYRSNGDMNIFDTFVFKGLCLKNVLHQFYPNQKTRHNFNYILNKSIFAYFLGKNVNQCKDSKEKR